MKRYILSAVAAAAFVLAPAWAQTQTPSSEAGGHMLRERNQRRRIRQGVRSGSLTPRQGARLSRQDKRINHEAARMARRNGGQLSERQEGRIHRQMNRQGRRIYRAKH
jgi:hypothetical protein